MQSLLGNLGVALALLGALCTAIPHARAARIGFLAYILADLPLLSYSLLLGDTRLSLMYGGFISFASLGIWLRSTRGHAWFNRMLAWQAFRRRRHAMDQEVRRGGA